MSTFDLGRFAASIIEVPRQNSEPKQPSGRARGFTFFHVLFICWGKRPKKTINCCLKLWQLLVSSCFIAFLLFMSDSLTDPADNLEFGSDSFLARLIVLKILNVRHPKKGKKSWKSCEAAENCSVIHRLSFLAARYAFQPGPFFESPKEYLVPGPGMMPRTASVIGGFEIDMPWHLQCVIAWRWLAKILLVSQLNFITRESQQIKKSGGLALNALELDCSQSDDCPMRNKDSCRSKTSSELSRQSEGAKWPGTSRKNVRSQLCHPRTGIAATNPKCLSLQGSPTRFIVLRKSWNGDGSKPINYIKLPCLGWMNIQKSERNFHVSPAIPWMLYPRNVDLSENAAWSLRAYGIDNIHV